MKCPGCGKENPDNSMFCGICGTHLQERKSENNKKKRSQGKRFHRMIAAGIILLVIALIYAGVLVFRKIDDKKFQDYTASADKYFQQLDYKRAEEEYLKAIAIDPKQEKPYLKLADIYVEQDKQKQAIMIIEQGEQSAGKSTKLSKKKEKLENSKAIGEEIKTEGFFYYNSEDISVNMSALDGGSGKIVLSIYYTVKRDNITDMVSFRWNSDDGEYRQIKGETTGEYKITVKEKDDSVLVSLSDKIIEKTIFQDLILDKRGYFNQTNIILAIENYVRSGESELLQEGSVRISTDGAANRLYNEQFLIPVYKAGEEDERNAMYEIVVASQAFEEAGEAAVYTEKDIQKILSGSESFLAVEPLEQFNVNDYFTFE